MKGIKVGRWPLLLLSLFVSFYAMALTQVEFDRAVDCCWNPGSPWGTYCSSRGQCAEGASCCYSPYFLTLDSVVNGNLQCSAFFGATGSRTAAAKSIEQATGVPETNENFALFGADGQFNSSALGVSGSEACGPVAPPSFLAAAPTETPNKKEIVDTEAFNANGISVERLALAENENALPRVIGFLPFDDRFAVEDDTLYAVGWSETRGYELVEVGHKGEPKVYDFNPEGSSFAGYPFYDHRSIKAFDKSLYFYARNPDQEFEFSSLRGGRSYNELDADPFGSDIPLVFRSDGGLRFQPGHIQPFGIFRKMLVSAGSLRSTFLADDGTVLVGPRVYDLEPQRLGKGKKSVVEIVNVYPGGPARPRNMVEFNGAVYMIAKTAGGFSACGPGRDYELVRLNDDGSSEVIEINPDHYGFYPDVEYPPMQVVGGDLYFVANLGPEGGDRHELVRLTPAHDVSVVPINPDGGAFPTVDEMFQLFANWDVISAKLEKRGDALYVLGANIGGECTAGCGNPYETEIVKVDSGGAVTVIDPTPGAGSTYMTWDPQFFLPRFVATQFNNDFYLYCGFCNDQPLYRLNADDSIESFSEYPVEPFRHNTDNVVGIVRGKDLYMKTFSFDEDFNVTELLIKVDKHGQFSSLTSAEMGFGFIYEMVVLGDTIIAGANIFSGPEPDFDTNFLSGELLIIHKDDSLGYVELAPGFDEDGYPHGSYPRGLRVIKDKLTFTSYTDPTYESEFHELFRLENKGKKGKKDKARAFTENAMALSAESVEESVTMALAPRRAWPVVRPVTRPGSPEYSPRLKADEWAWAMAMTKGRPSAVSRLPGSRTLGQETGLDKRLEYRSLAYQRHGLGLDVFLDSVEKKAAARAARTSATGSCSADMD